MRWQRGLAAVALLTAGGAARAATYHVAQGELRGVPVTAVLRSLREAAARVKAGDTVIVHGGVYREPVEIAASGAPGKPIRFLAAPGARVVVTGADRLTEWRREPGEPAVYSTPWPHRFIDWEAGNAHGGPPPIGRAEQVFVDGYLQHQVLERRLLSPGSFWVDLEGKRLHLCPADNLVSREPARIDRLVAEASGRLVVWRVKGAHVTTKGFTFRYAANHAQCGMVTVDGPHARFEDCAFLRSNGEGIVVGAPDCALVRCEIAQNGFSGFSAVRAHRLRMADCTVRDNNVKNFDRGWGGSGDKIVLSRDVVIERCRFVENRGVGLWFDIGNERCTVRHCLIARNELAGIFYEISYGLHAHDNVIVGNGHDPVYGSWGVTAGISLSSSEGCVIERNLLVGNAEGLSFREQLRTTPRIGGDETREVPIWNRGHVVRNNVLAHNGVQVWGWFAAGDERHWPRRMQRAPAKSAAPDGDLAAAYGAKDETGQPKGLALEDLKLTMDRNLYWPGPAGGLLHWGTEWERCERYADLGRVRRDLGLEAGGRMADPRFADPASLDLRVPPGSPALATGCYPRGGERIPGARVGVWGSASPRSGAPDSRRRASGD